MVFRLVFNGLLLHIAFCYDTCSVDNSPSCAADTDVDDDVLASIQLRGDVQTNSGQVDVVLSETENVAEDDEHAVQSQQDRHGPIESRMPGLHEENQHHPPPDLDHIPHGRFDQYPHGEHPSHTGEWPRDEEEEEEEKIHKYEEEKLCSCFKDSWDPKWKNLKKDTEACQVCFGSRMCRNPKQKEKWCSTPWADDHCPMTCCAYKRDKLNQTESPCKTLAPCCEGCDPGSFCSPETGKCYGWRVQPHYESCQVVNPRAVVDSLQSQIPDVVLLSNHSEYRGGSQWRRISARWAGRGHSFEPIAVVEASTTNHVQVAVKCASQHGLQVCASNGGHRSNHYDGCSGGVLVDMRNIAYRRELEKDGHGQKVIQIGSGISYQELYGDLGKNSFVIPGDFVVTQSAADMILVCGEDLLVTQRGLSCDAIKAITYVDDNGRSKRADAEENEDMFWMARGGGGELPGIVTSFEMEVFPAPKHVTKLNCSLHYNQSRSRIAKAMLERWSDRLYEMVQPYRRIFTGFRLVRSASQQEVQFTNYCFDCNADDLQWYRDEVSSIARVGHARCDDVDMLWEDVLKDEFEDSMKWSDAVAGTTAEVDNATRVGGLVANEWHIPASLSDDLFRWVFDPTWGQSILGIFLYPIGGPLVDRVGPSETAYGARDAKISIHTKFHGNDANAEKFEWYLNRLKLMQQALEKQLPCKGLYQHLDEHMTCASCDREKLLQAYFSDASRVSKIKQEHDPKNVFKSRLVSDSPLC